MVSLLLLLRLNLAAPRKSNCYLQAVTASACPTARVRAGNRQSPSRCGSAAKKSISVSQG